MASNSETNTSNFTPMWLKIIVDENANKVVFAEADQDFVDLIFHLMTLPLASISKLLYTQDHTVASCKVGALYQSIHDLHTDCFPSNLSKDSLLSPKTAMAFPLFSFFDFPNVGPEFYTCKSCCRITDCAGTICPNCNWTMKSCTYHYASPTTSNMLESTNAKYVRGGAAYVVTDNMEVKPMSVSFVMSLFQDLDDLQQLHVQVGPQEAREILQAVMENRDVLTSVFLQEKMKEEAIN